MKQVYALLVAIDEYPTAHHRLNGCANDMTAMKDFLERRFDAGQAQLHLRVLQNEQATRQALVDGFSEHLAKAGKDDLAFFYFSGHGSQEPAHEAFWPWEETKMNQSMVCWDSRQPGGMDLADKELGYLIWKVSAQCPNVVLVMDCCHSGSGSRSAGEESKTRQMEDQKGRRPLESYLGYDRYVFRDGQLAEIPNGPHILLAAAHSKETAKETRFDGKARGVFTFSLLDTLLRARNPISYQTLRERTQTKVYNLSEAQTPQLEVTDTADAHRLFLDGTVASATEHHALAWMDDRGAWVIQAGGLQGIPAPDPLGRTFTEFYLYDENSPEADWADPAKALGTARVTAVLPSMAELAVPAALDGQRERGFVAVLKGLANPPMRLYLSGDAEGVALLRKRLLEGAGGRVSSHIALADTLEEANFQAISNHGEYVIARAHDRRPLVMKAKGFDVNKTFKDLDHIARWVKTSETGNPTTGFAAFPLRVELLQLLPNSREEIAVPLEEAIFQAKYVHGAWEPKQFKIRFTNTFHEPLYVGILYLSGRYAIQHLPVSVFVSEDLHGKKTRRFEYVRQVQPGESFEALSGGALTAKLSADFAAAGITRGSDLLKLFASTDAFDLAKFEQQAALELPVPNARTTVTVIDGDMADMMEGDWCTKDIWVHTVQPLPLHPFGYNQPYALFGSVLEGHSQCSGMASWGTEAQASAGLGRSVYPPVLPNGLEAEGVKLTEGWKSDMGLAVLELFELKGREAVSEQVPLVVKLGPSVPRPEEVVAVAPEGAGYRVVGKAQGDSIRIAHLPAPTPTASEQLPDSVKIVFLRLGSRYAEALEALEALRR